MARLKHATTGVVVEVDDSLTDRLGSEWSAEKQETRSRAKKSESDTSE